MLLACLPNGQRNKQLHHVEGGKQSNNDRLLKIMAMLTGFKFVLHNNLATLKDIYKHSSINISCVIFSTFDQYSVRLIQIHIDCSTAK